jgi:hypothetical protein
MTYEEVVAKMMLQIEQTVGESYAELDRKAKALEKLEGHYIGNRRDNVTGHNGYIIADMDAEGDTLLALADALPDPPGKYGPVILANHLQASLLRTAVERTVRDLSVEIEALGGECSLNLASLPPKAKIERVNEMTRKQFIEKLDAADVHYDKVVAKADKQTFEVKAGYFYHNNNADARRHAALVALFPTATITVRDDFRPWPRDSYMVCEVCFPAEAN